jgi:hypothetical protein
VPGDMAMPSKRDAPDGMSSALVSKKQRIEDTTVSVSSLSKHRDAVRHPALLSNLAA